MPNLSASMVTLALLLLVSGCGGASEAPQAVPEVSVPEQQVEGPIVAEVQGLKISAAEFELAAARVVPANGEFLNDEEKREVLEELVTERMLFLEAKKEGIDLDPKVQKVMINTLLRQDVYSGVRNSDFTVEELQAYFEAHKDEFVVPEKVQIRRIFIKAAPTRDEQEALAKAQELRALVVADPMSFRELASEFSEDPYRRRGGDLGYLSAEGKPGIDPLVVSTAFALETGAVSEPFLAGGGYNVILVAGRRDRVERTFEQMKGSVLRKVKNDRYKELYREYVDKIGDQYKVTISDKVLADLEVKPSRRPMLAPGRGPGRLFDLDEEGEAETEEEE